MKQFMLMHIGFEKPTQSIMEAWGSWFERVAPRTLENVGLRNGREIGKNGTADLPMGLDAVTGYTIVSADSFEEAQELASTNPFVSSIRIYELVTH